MTKVIKMRSGSRKSSNESRSMVSRIVAVACAVVAAYALVRQDDDDDDGNGSGGIKVMVSKVVIAAIAAMGADYLVDRLFALRSALVNDDHDDNNYVMSSSDSGSSWSFPPRGWIKCNVDASVPHHGAPCPRCGGVCDGVACAGCGCVCHGPPGCGGVFRDSTGSWLYGFAKSLETCTSSAAELIAISTGLDMAKKKGFHKLILETDSLTAYKILYGIDGSSAHSSQEKKLVNSIKKLLEDGDWHVNIVPVDGDNVNKVADWLANLSHGLQVGDQIEFSKPPDECQSCRKLMDEDVRLAKNAKPERPDKFKRNRTKSTVFILVLSLLLTIFLCVVT